MSEELSRLTARVAALRADFDRAFEQPISTPDHDLVPLLCVRVANRKAALRLDEVRGLHLESAIARVPGSSRELLGLATLRGELWPVYDLAALVGWEGSGLRRVLCLARGEPALAFAFEHLDSLRRVHASEIIRVPSLGLSSEALRDGEDVVPLLSLAALGRRGRGVSEVHG